MNYGSVCSGIEAATSAWHGLGWNPAWFAEIEPFPSAVLAHHYPDVANLGDMTRISARVLSGDVEAPDVLVGGTPCQAFSVAGLRKSLEDDRGQLSIAYIHLADAIESVRDSRGLPPPVMLWENVPGVLSTKDNAFGCFLAGIAGEECELQPAGKRWTDAGCVYGPKRTVAWRVLDAQYFGLAQRRRRVFVVASSRKDIDPVSILFERDSLRRDIAPSREAGKEVAGTISSRTTGGGGLGTDFECAGGLQPVASRMVAFGEYAEGDTASTVKARDHKDATDLVTYGIPANWIGRKPENGPNQVTPSIDISPCLTVQDRHGVAHPIAFDTTQITSPENGSNPKPGAPCHPLAAKAHPPAIAFDCKAPGQNGFGIGEIASTMRSMNASGGHQNGGGHLAVMQPVGAFFAGQGAKAGSIAYNEHVSPTLKASDSGTNRTPSAHVGMAVRRLTPVECERLQGFPDNYTQIPWKGADASDCPDGHRYKALGNSMAVQVMRWIGARIDGAARQ